MRDTTTVWGASLLCFIVVGCCGCGDGTLNERDDGDSSPTDIDADAMFAGDVDADTEDPIVVPEDWPEPDPAREFDADTTGVLSFETCFDQADVVGICLDSDDDDPDARCCNATSHSWIAGDFDSCSDLATCGWSTFASEADGADAVRLADGTPWVVLGGDGVGEVGLYSAPVADTTSEPLVSFVAALDASRCTPETCRQAFGVALTDQTALGAGTSVAPIVGIVLDGELNTAHLYVAGRLEQRVPILLEELTTPRGYGYQLRPDGSVAFWLGLEAGAMPTPAELELMTPSYVSTRRAAQDVQVLRLALYGRLDGAGAARVGTVRLQRDVCDVAAGFRREPRAVRTAIRPTGRAGRPAVIAIPTGETAPGADVPPATLLMVFETARDLAVATSCRGADWRYLGPALPHTPPAQYGRVARRAPALVYWNGTYHLWFEGVTDNEQNRTAIVHAVSENGLSWRLDDTEAFGADQLADDTNEVGEPTVVALDDGRLAMWFVARTSLGVGTIRRASSNDGKDWIIDETAIAFEPTAPADFERDGVEQPVVLLRGSRLHMWYRGRDGARSSIGAAVALDASGLRWRRLGAVLEASNPWEVPGVGGPALLTMPGPNAETGRLHMWYQAGGAGRERIGLATREVPLRP